MISLLRIILAALAGLAPMPAHHHHAATHHAAAMVAPVVTTTAPVASAPASPAPVAAAPHHRRVIPVSPPTLFHPNPPSHCRPFMPCLGDPQ